MAAAASLADKATKVFASLCAGATIVGVSTLVVNVYYNTGKHRNLTPTAKTVEGNGLAGSVATDAPTNSKSS